MYLNARTKSKQIFSTRYVLLTLETGLYRYYIELDIMDILINRTLGNADINQKNGIRPDRHDPHGFAVSRVM